MTHGAQETQLLVKDAVLDQLAEVGNVAQFVSFAPNLTQRFARMHGYAANHRFVSAEQAVNTLLAAAPERSVNIRSFDPAVPESREFKYGLTDSDQALRELRRLADDGLHTIVNETVDVNDGGVSGVALGDVIEFAPGDTPRAVEKAGVASLPRELALELLHTVYGFSPALDYSRAERVEFSIHPIRRGVRHDHTIVWQVEAMGSSALEATLQWPNRFSYFVGDKVFGLLVAHHFGLRVPRTTVFARKVAPFSFGHSTGTSEPWIRTSPTEQVPGRFKTARAWRDPFRLMQTEDPSGTLLASVIAQEGVDARYSGALIASPSGEPIIEGVVGYGDEFMVGRSAPVELPNSVVSDVRAVFDRAAARVGPVRFEWVYDGREVWIVQFHRGATSSDAHIIVPGDASRFHRFDVSAGIEALRTLIAELKGSPDGITLVGRVGVTSHFGDLLRRAKIPARLEMSGSVDGASGQ